jgi:actin-related protein 3
VFISSTSNNFNYFICASTCSRLASSRAKASALHESSDVHDIKVNVIENHAETASVWLGGSILASSGDFFDSCFTKAQYEEEGARIFRKNVAFKAQL